MKDTFITSDGDTFLVKTKDKNGKVVTFKVQSEIPLKEGDAFEIVKEVQKNRTKKSAGETSNIPPNIPAITNKDYQNGMTLNNDNKAYLQPLSQGLDLKYEDGKLFFSGLQTTAVSLKQYFSHSKLDKIDLPLLRLFYGIILKRFYESSENNKPAKEIVTIYYPDLVKVFGGNSHADNQKMQSCINKIMTFQNIIGILDHGKAGKDVLPVLVYMGCDVKKNTISFSSPYMWRIIDDIYKASEISNKTQIPTSGQNKKSQMLPSYSCLIKSSIAKEKNKKAVEIVFTIVTLIEQCGNNVPHIKASTIIKRNQLLKQAIENSKTTKAANTILERTFSKAWELLSKQTELAKKYKNIQLPDPTQPSFKALWIPTSSNLDIIFSFPHKGKK